MADNRPIGVFDSGLGGLTVVRALKKYLPNEDIVYFGDTGRVPYGTRSNDIVKKYAREDEAFLLSQNVKMIIAACGTVSSVAYMTAEDLPVPFFEVVTPAATAAAKLTKSGRVGVLGTPVTINSRSHARAILRILPDAVIAANSCPLFVPLVEEGWISEDDTVTLEVAKRYLEPIKKANVDTLILGCTHYPALKTTIEKVMGEGIALVDAGVATADSVKRYLEENGMLNLNGGKIKYFVSDRPDSFSKTAKILMGEGPELDVSQVNIFDYI